MEAVLAFVGVRFFAIVLTQFDVLIEFGELHEREAALRSNSAFATLGWAGIFEAPFLA